MVGTVLAFLSVISPRRIGKMVVFDMTAQLAPVAWGILGLLIVSAAGIFAQALPSSRSMTKNTGRTTRTLRPVSLPA